MRRRVTVGDCVVRMVYDSDLEVDLLSVLSFSGEYNDNKRIATSVAALATALRVGDRGPILLRCQSLNAFARTREARWRIVGVNRSDTIDIMAVQEAVDMVARTIKERELRGR